MDTKNPPIELIRSKEGPRGSFAIHVGGVRWGMAVCNWHGSNGNSFTFENEYGLEIEVPYKIALSGGRKGGMKVFRVDGDKMIRRRLPHDAVVRPLTTRSP